MSLDDGGDRATAYARVMRQRQDGRSRSAPLRAFLGTLGALLLVAAVPLVVVLPEAGVPALLLGLRLLAVEFDWAARGYAWVTWRWGRLLAWFHARSKIGRALLISALFAVAALLVWGLAEEFV